LGNSGRNIIGNFKSIIGASLVKIIPGKSPGPEWWPLISLKETAA